MTLMNPAIIPQDRRASVGESVWYMGSLLTLHATAAETAGQFGLVEFLAKPGSEPPFHLHEREDELFFVIEGEVDYLLPDKTIPAGPGTSVFLPRGIPHSFRIRTEQAKFLVLVTPGGFEGYFRELSRPAEAATIPSDMPTYSESDLTYFADLAEKYGIRFVTPEPSAQGAAA